MVVLGVIVAVSIGAVLIVHASSGGNAAQVTYMKATLDKLPLPTGAVLIYESYTEAHGDVAAYAQRDYRLSTDHATAALRTC
jgi:acetyl esterase/lipase